MKPVKGYEGLYEVFEDGKIYSFYTNRYLKQTICGGGYYGVSLVKNKNKKTEQIHRLVAEAYIENTENKPCVNHIDGNKLNNCVDNLEWVSYLENTSHAIETELMKTKGKDHPMYGKKHKKEALERMSAAKVGKCGSKHPRSTPIAKINPITNEILEIYESQGIAAKNNNLSQGTINMVLKGLRKTTGGYSWRYI